MNPILATLGVAGISLAGASVVSTHDMEVARDTTTEQNRIEWEQKTGNNLIDSVGTRQAFYMIANGEINTFYMDDQVIQIDQLPSIDEWRENVEETKDLFEEAYLSVTDEAERKTLIDSAPGMEHDQFSDLSFLSELEKYNGFIDGEGGFYLNK